MVKYYGQPENAGAAPPTARIVVCVNQRLSASMPSCAGRGSHDLLTALRTRAKARDLDLAIETFECFGQCEHGPNVRIAPGGPFMRELQPADADRVLDAWLEFSRNRPAEEP